MALRLVLILACFFLSPVVVHAENYGLTVGVLLDEGIKAYKSGDQVKAIDQFSKVLLIESGNKTAREYLEKMGLTRGLYGQSASTLEQIAVLNQETKIYKDKITGLEKTNAEQLAAAQKLREERDTLCRMMEEKKQEVDLLAIQLKVLEADLHNRDASFEESVEQFKALSQDKAEENEFLKRIVERHKALVGEKEILLEQKDGDLAGTQERLREIEAEKLQDVLALERKLNEKELELAGLKNNLSAADAQAAALSPEAGDERSVELLKARDQYIADLKGKLAESKKEVSFLKKNFQEISREEIQKLKDQLADNDQAEEISILKERLSDAQERLTLVDSIVAEKESRIEGLANELAQTREQCGEKCAENTTAP